jgi:hypothetical protein
MTWASGLIVLALAWLAAATYLKVFPLWENLLVSLFITGMGYCAVQIPSGRLIRQSGSDNDLSALFAAQFALSHACWLVTYSLSGWVGARLGLVAALVVMAVLALLSLGAALLVWRREPRGDTQ